MEQFVSDVKTRYEERGNCVVSVSEGIHYADGSFVSEAKTSGTDGFGHAQLGGLAARLTEVIKERVGCNRRRNHKFWLLSPEYPGKWTGFKRTTKKIGRYAENRLFRTSTLGETQCLRTKALNSFL